MGRTAATELHLHPPDGYSHPFGPGSENPSEDESPGKWLDKANEVPLVKHTTTLSVLTLTLNLTLSGETHSQV